MDFADPNIPPSHFYSDDSESADGLSNETFSDSALGSGTDSELESNISSPPSRCPTPDEGNGRSPATDFGYRSPEPIDEHVLNHVNCSERRLRNILPALSPIREGPAQPTPPCVQATQGLPSNGPGEKPERRLTDPGVYKMGPNPFDGPYKLVHSASDPSAPATDGRIPCRHCNATFAHRQSFYRHKKYVHKKEISTCQHSEEEFSRPDALKAHLAKNLSSCTHTSRTELE